LIVDADIENRYNNEKNNLNLSANLSPKIKKMLFTEENQPVRGIHRAISSISPLQMQFKNEANKKVTNTQITTMKLLQNIRLANFELVDLQGSINRKIMTHYGGMQSQKYGGIKILASRIGESKSSKVG